MLGNHENLHYGDKMEDDKLCDYGCGNKAKFLMTNNKLCCKSHYINCPNVSRGKSNRNTSYLKVSSECEFCCHVITGLGNINKHKKVCTSNPDVAARLCLQCKKPLTRKNTPWSYDSAKTFCDLSCSALYHNTHNKKAIRRSKNELYLFNLLKATFPSLEIIPNDRSILDGLEIDIWIPALKLAIEWNGIVHYKPIYGEANHDRTVEKDQRKISLSAEKDIRLIVIADVTSTRAFVEEQSPKVIKIIQELQEASAFL